MFAELAHNSTSCAYGQVLKESFKLYRAINDGIINLVDKVSVPLDAVLVGIEN